MAVLVIRVVEEEKLLDDKRSFAIVNLLPLFKIITIMASVKELKKDIDLIMSLALSDCFYVLEYNAKVDEKAVMTIAGEIIQKHRELRVLSNHPDGKDNPKLVKQFYKKLVTDMLGAVDASLEKLSVEVKKVA